MSRPESTGATQQPLQLSPLERPAFAHLFSLADTSKSGLITGEQAVEFFNNAVPPLPPATLGLIWSLADSANNGFLTAPSFSIALRLIAHAQRGEPADASAIHKPGAPPTFKGVTLPSQTTANSNSAFNPPPSNANNPNNPNYIPISPADRSRYMRIFANSNPRGGLIDGDKAKEIFVKSKLPFDKLGAIWNLADTHARGSLDATDFIIGMHFIQHTMSGRLNSIPAALPPGLYEQASNGAPISNAIPNLPSSPTSNPVVAQSTGGSQGGGFGTGGLSRQITGSNVPIPRQVTGQQAGISRQVTGQQTTQGAPSGYMSPSHSGSTFAPAQARGNWLVSPAEQIKSDRFFDGLDVEKTGALEGQAVVPFFMQSGLSEQVLAHIWDLSDITQSGSLSREEFAVAMYLINGKLAGQEPPQELPENLVPPSLRGKNLPEAINPQESDTQRDLFSLMDDDPAPLPISTASAFINPAAQSALPSASSSTSRQAPTATTSGPFDDDFFGSPAPNANPPRSAIASPAAVTPNVTGARAAPTASKVSFVDDASAELGNKQLQLENTTKAATSLQSQRQDLSDAVSGGAASLAEIESRLAQARATHESESKLVADLQERQRAQNESLKTSREELIRAESDLSALRAEKDETEQAVMRDREDVRDLQRRMTAVQTETAELKSQLEKLKKEARQKKGMVAIGKKQLASAEGEKEKVEQEIRSVETGEADVGTETEAIQPVASATTVASPKSATGALSPSSVRSLNPFDRAGAGAGAGAGPGSEERTHSPSASLSTVGVGAGAGAAAGLAGAAVASQVSSHQGGDSAEAEKAPQAATEPTSSSGFDDAFGIPTSSGTERSSAAPAFDDDFGSGFDSGAASTANQPGVPGGTSTAFDDAFADFGDSQASEPQAAAASNRDAKQHSAPNEFGESFAPGEAVAAPVEQVPPSGGDPTPSSQAEANKHPESEDQVAPLPESGLGPTQDDEDSEDDVPLSETSAAKRRSRALDAGDLSQSSSSAPAQQDDAGDDSSDEEADGPEDLDSRPPRHRGASNATATPGTVGEVEAEQTAPASGSSLPPAETAGQASNRFPELPPVEDDPAASMPGSMGAAPEFSMVPNESQADGQEGLLSNTSNTSGLADGRTSRMTSEAGDDFHDAFDEAPSEEPSGATPLTSGALGTEPVSSGAGSTFSNVSQQGSETGHERFSTAVGDGMGSSAATTSDYSTPLASTATAAKRRAPPPAPVKNATSLTPTGGAGSAELSKDPFGPTSSATSTNQANLNPQATSFDDFDSAFEDLGLNSGTQPSTANASASAGFDDAFGGDSDFDFVPSFATTNQPNVGATQPVGSSSNGFDGFGASNQQTNNSNSFAGFDDFDSAFNPDVSSSNPRAAQNSSNSNSNSNSGSGFSFEDAFDPSAASAPSLPARRSNATTTQQSAPPPSSAPSATSAPSSQPDNALPDDAGQVKQLCGMGFSRSKVIKALEKSNYRTEKALERLLAEA